MLREYSRAKRIPSIRELSGAFLNTFVTSGKFSCILIKLPNLMTQEIPLELYKWLHAHQTIQAVRPTFRPNGKCQLDAVTSNQFANGWRIAQLVDQLQIEKGLVEVQNVSQTVKNSSTPASKLYNWTLISEALEKLGFPLKKETQREILSGSFQSLVEFLFQLMRKMAPPIVIPPSQKTPNREKLKKPEVIHVQTEPKEIDINKIKADKDPALAQSLLEFIILLSGKTLDLPPKQVVALLSDNCNYFAHLLVKGMKGSYVQLWNLLDKLNESVKIVVNLIKQDTERNFKFLLQLMKPGLLSKSQSIVIKTQDTLSSIIRVLKADISEQNWVFNYLCKQNSLFETLYLSFRRHPSLAKDLYPLVWQISSGNMSDFYVIYFKKAAPTETEYLKTVLLLLEPMTYLKQSEQELLNSGVIINWLRICETIANSNDPSNFDARVFAMELMCELCKKYPETAEDADQDLNKILDILKKFSRSQSQILRINAINRLFDFLQENARNKNRYASLIYKKMIFLFLENHEQIEIRQITLQSFIRLFNEFPTIPVDLIVQPFIKQLQVAEGSTYLLNIVDLSFIKQVVAHPKLTLKFGSMIAEFLAKLYTKNIAFSKLILKSMVVLFERFREQSEFQDFLAKLTKDYMTLYNTLTQKRGRRGQDSQIINGQKRALIIQLLKFCIQLDEVELNQKIKVLVGQTYNNLIDQKKYKDKGLFTLLSIFGIPEVLAEQVRNKGHNQFKSLQINNSKVISADAPQGLRRNKTTPKKLLPLDDSRTDPLIPNVGQSSFDEKSLMDQHGIGYKPLKKLQAKAQNKSLDHIKPDPKVVNEIEKIRLRYMQQQTKKQLVKLEIQKRENVGRSISKGEILQKNISLGFYKIADTANPRTIFQFDSVKEGTLPSHLQLIKIDEQQDRDAYSVSLTLKKMFKIMKVLFVKFSSATQATRRTQGLHTSEDPSGNNFISFAQIMRLLKDRNLGKLPSKVIVSEVIKQLNSDIKKDRNVLIGVDDEHFEEFLVQISSIIDSYDPDSRAVTLPLGVKLQQFIQGIMEGQIQKFEDPQEEQILAKYHKTGQIPDGYKGFYEKGTVVHNSLTNQTRNQISESYSDCFEIVDEILRDVFQTGPIQQWSSVEDQIKIRRIDIYNLPRGARNSESASQLRRKRSQKKFQKQKEKEKKSEQDALKEERRKERAQKVKMELEEQRIKKMQEQSEKKRKAKQEQDQRLAKRQRERKAYVEAQKQLIKQHQRKQNEQKMQKEREKNEQQKSLNQRKKQQKQQFWKKHDTKIKEHLQLKNMKVKQSQSLEQKKKKEQQIKRQNLAKQLHNVMAEDKKVQQRQAQTGKAIKQLLNSAQSRNQLKKYDEQLKGLFKHYAQVSDFKIQQTQKLISMKGYVAFLKDYSVSPGLLKQQDCLKIYKYMQRETESKQGLRFEEFLELLMRLAVKLDGQLTVKDHNFEEKPGQNQFQHNGEVQQPVQVGKVSPQVLQKLFKYLKLGQARTQSKAK